MINRRDVLARLGGVVACTAAGVGLGAALCPVVAQAQEMAAQSSVPLRLFNPNTQEAYDLQLFVGSAWNANALIACDWLMRDWRQQKLVNCDRRLYAALYVLQRYFGDEARVQINSGFRTPETNEILREMGMNPAINSQHLRAMAVDFLVPGADLTQLARAVWKLNLGGVGLYESFVHMDSRGNQVNWGRSF